MKDHKAPLSLSSTDADDDVIRLILGVLETVVALALFLLKIENRVMQDSRLNKLLCIPMMNEPIGTI